MECSNPSPKGSLPVSSDIVKASHSSCFVQRSDDLPRDSESRNRRGLSAKAWISWLERRQLFRFMKRGKFMMTIAESCRPWLSTENQLQP